MPKRNKIDVRIRVLIQKHADRMIEAITAAVKKQIAKEVRTVKGPRQGGGKRRQRRKKPSMICIAPQCKRRSRGPRFRYLCKKHAGTPKRVLNKWRKAARG